LGYALMAGLLMGGHAYIHDFSILLAAYAALAPGLTRPFRISFQFILLPVLCYGLIVGAPYNVLPAMALFGFMTAAAIHYYRRPSLPY